MTLFDERKEKLINELRDKEYRDAFTSEHIASGIPFQIKALRDQREWSQKELGKKATMLQERISVLEDPNYAKFNINTLKKIASAFDVGLVVRFVPFSELAEWELNLSSDSLKVPSFNEERYFQEKDLSEEKDISDGTTYSHKIDNVVPNNVTWMNKHIAKKAGEVGRDSITSAAKIGEAGRSDIDSAA